MVIADPKEGLNTRKLVCPRCSKQSGIVHLGANKFAGICPACKTFNIGLADTFSACEKCGCTDIKPRVVPPDIELPKICDTCMTEIVKTSDLFKAGGVVWKCDACGNTGTAEPQHPIALAARAKGKIMAPEPCLALLSEKTCPVCLEREEKGDKN